MKPQIQIRTLEELAFARDCRKAVFGKWFNGKRMPAAFVINMPGDIILRVLKDGLYVYRKHQEKDNG